jgi:hypothetical protein
MEVILPLVEAACGWGPERENNYFGCFHATHSSSGAGWKSTASEPKGWARATWHPMKPRARRPAQIPPVLLLLTCICSAVERWM